MTDYRTETANGYKVFALRKTGFSNGEENLYTMVGVKKKQYIGNEYVIGFNYTLSDGTWGNGMYTTNYERAMQIFAKDCDPVSRDTVLIATYEDEDTPLYIIGVYHNREDAIKRANESIRRESDEWELDEYDHCYEVRNGKWYEWNIYEETVM